MADATADLMLEVLKSVQARLAQVDDVGWIEHLGPRKGAGTAFQKQKAQSKKGPRNRRQDGKGSAELCHDGERYLF